MSHFQSRSYSDHQFWVVFTRPHRRCCIRSANYCKFLMISLLVCLVDVIALFLVMWPLSWYQFCVSLPLEVRTVGLVLFLQVLTLLSVLHCLPPAGHVEPVFSDSTFSAAVRRNMTQKRKSCLLAVPPLCPAKLDMTFCLWKPLPHLPPSSPRSWSHVYHISALRETCPVMKPRRSRRGGNNEPRKIKVVVGIRDRLPSDSSSSSTPSHQPAELGFCRFSSVLLPHSDQSQHDTAGTPASPPNDRDDLTASSLSAPLRLPLQPFLFSTLALKPLSWL